MQKPRTLWPLLALLYAVLGSRAPVFGALSTGLVGHYLMNGSLADTVGNGRDPILSGARFGPDRFGTPDGAISFASKDDTAISMHPLLPGGAKPRTLSFWTKVEAYDTEKYPTFISYGTTTAKGALCGIFIENGSKVFMVDNWGERVVDTKRPSVPLDTWTHVAFSYDGIVGKIYENGRLIAENAIGLNTTDNGKLRFGSMDAERYLKGSIDDVRLYDRVLSDLEITAIFNLESSTAQGTSTYLKARGIATVNSGFLTGIVVTEPGRGYTNAPNIQILGSGTGARALAQIRNGTVVNVIILAAGSGYTEAPTILFDPPLTTPTLRIAASSVRVTLTAVTGRKYQFETSVDAQFWTPAGEPFIAGTDEVSTIFPVENSTQTWRIKEIP